MALGALAIPSQSGIYEADPGFSWVAAFTLASPLLLSLNPPSPPSAPSLVGSPLEPPLCPSYPPPSLSCPPWTFRLLVLSSPPAPSLSLPTMPSAWDEGTPEAGAPSWNPGSASKWLPSHCDQMRGFGILNQEADSSAGHLNASAQRCPCREVTHLPGLGRSVHKHGSSWGHSGCCRSRGHLACEGPSGLCTLEMQLPPSQQLFCSGRDRLDLAVQEDWLWPGTGGPGA